MVNEWFCPLCEGQEFEQIFEKRANIKGVERRFVLARCQKCSLLSLQPRPLPDEILYFYPMDYEPFWLPIEEEPNLFLRWIHRRHFAIRCHVVESFFPNGGNLLDIGCGTGGFLAMLRRNNRWYGVGVDINEQAASVARRQGLCVFCGDLNQMFLPAGFFDVATMWEVLEHVRDPLNILKTIHHLLKPKGILLLSTPNANSWQARLWRESWKGWDTPRHLQIFSLQTLRELLNRSGFTIVRRLAFPMERYYAIESCWQYLHFQQINVDAVRNIMRQVIELVGWIGWPLFHLANRMPFASSLVLAAQKTTQDE